MKKSLIVLAALGAFASVASAQSSVTLYGRVDLSVGKNAGSTASTPGVVKAVNTARQRLAPLSQVAAITPTMKPKVLATRK